jgi:DNA (cytosine-5)-methyltransferase 1
MHKQSRLIAVDVYSGAGGLSLGLTQADFNVVAAIEINPKYADTYQINHKNTKLILKDIREVTGKEIFKTAKVSKIDLIAGCPPCQGFSSLTRKYRRYDSRNDLVLEMARIIEEIRPKMVMMENVAGLADRGKPILNEFISRLEKCGYIVTYKILQLADYGIPQSRRRLVLLAGKGFKIPIPLETHCLKSDKKNKKKPWLKLSDVIKSREKPVTLSVAKKMGGSQNFNWHVVRDLKEISLERLKAIGAGENRQVLPKNLRPKCHVNSNKGFTNVYGRMSWDKTPPTITSGCTTPAMGRFGHPDKIRTISVREASLIQTFPKNYVFATDHIDTACELVGNALPPMFAKLAACWCKNSFFDYKMKIST